MHTEGFDFFVEESFTMTGRGVAVVGDVVGGSLASGDPGYVRVQGQGDVAVHRIDVEWVLQRGTDRVALLLRYLDIEQVPPGSLVRSIPRRTQQDPQ